MTVVSVRLPQIPSLPLLSGIPLLTEWYILRLSHLGKNVQVHLLALPWSSVVKNLPASAGDLGLVPDLGSHLPHPEEQLCPCATTIKPVLYSPVERRQWHPTPALLPGKSHGRRSLVGCSPWGH